MLLFIINGDSMIIDFKNKEETSLPNFKGGEKELKAKMYFDGKTRIMRGILEQGSSIGFHKHETNSEIIFILSGNGKVLFDEDVEYVSAGQCHFCPQGHSHSLINEKEEPLEFYACVPELG